MIIVKIYGGLGNQMFQYAFGRSLALHYKTELKLDTSAFTAKVSDPKTGVRVFSLSHYGITAPTATAAELAKFKSFPDKIFKKLALLQDKHPHYYKKKILLEPKSNLFTFDPKVFTRTIDTDFYCEGFFQSPKYFESVADQIRSEFIVRTDPDEENAKMLAKITSQNSVALHIRHGDNASAVAKNHGVLPLEYYDEALKKLGAQEKELCLYVFSDDPVWAKENLKTKYPVVFVTHNDDSKNYEDLRLMSACRHHIIGNSTFSWWGAWLGKKPGQRVFAPRYYYVGQDISGKDFYPPEWTVV